MQSRWRHQRTHLARPAQGPGLAFLKAALSTPAVAWQTWNRSTYFLLVKHKEREMDHVEKGIPPEALLRGQQEVLELVARNAPLSESLSAIAAFAEAIHGGSKHSSRSIQLVAPSAGMKLVYQRTIHGALRGVLPSVQNSFCGLFIALGGERSQQGNLGIPQSVRFLQI